MANYNMLKYWPFIGWLDFSPIFGIHTVNYRTYATKLYTGPSGNSPLASCSNWAENVLVLHQIKGVSE
jgi:hypothetical protein